MTNYLIVPVVRVTIILLPLWPFNFSTLRTSYNFYVPPTLLNGEGYLEYKINLGRLLSMFVG